MHFPFNCLGCGYENHAQWSQIGRRVCCRACGRAGIVPAPMEPIEEEFTSQFAIRFACPVCGRSFATKPALIGQKIRCSGCAAGVRVPAGNSFPVEHASRVVLNTIFESGRAIAGATGPAHGMGPSASHSIPVANAWRNWLTGNPESNRSMASPTGPTNAVGPPAGHSIPVANAWRFPLDGHSDSKGSMAAATGSALWAVEVKSDSDPDPSLSHDQLEAIGGLSRGEHAAVVLPSRGETMEHARQEAVKQAVAETTTSDAKPKKKKKKKSGFFDLQETLTLVGGVSVVVLVLALVAWWFPQFRFPFGALLAVIGAVLYLMAAISLRRLTEHLGFFKSLLFRFFPPYQLWFVLTRWEETRDYFAFIMSGLISVAVGVAIVITSPTYKAAEASERAYQSMVDEWVRGGGVYVPPPMMKKTDGGK